ncbi:MAG: restriction endonuclease subunit S [Clostridium perfringens]|uniref:restriction endonuclease subunit S n=1 Tax=Clostridium perfringens TaxID=1502 RepID=UPI0024BC4E86|nr:restriction endonuclease subunit S [Clostridium perfringens]MDU6896636.1 restriction endonuclease subunit S [Clostridium perfringens]MDU6933791.1 restriction endonuclease subunit S [Clostridium perfringens]
MNFNESKLGDLCEIRAGGTPSRSKSEYWDNGDIPWIKIGDINNKYVKNASEYITVDGLNNSSAKLFKKGTILYTIFATVGEVAILDFDATTNQAIVGLNHNEKIDTNYLYYFLKSQKDKISNISRGVAQNNINMSILKDIKVPIPDKTVQLKISEVLDNAQGLIDKRKKQIEELDLLVKSKFIEMFGDPSKNEKGWEISKIGKYLNVLTDYHSNGSYETLRDNVTLLDTPSYALMVRTTDLEKNNFEYDVKYIDEHAYNHLEKSKVFGGEIIINKIGSAGKVYLMPFLNRPVSLAMNQFLLRFDENKVNHIFLYNLLSTSYMEIKINEKVRGAVTKTITKDAIKEINIIIPPIELQNQFADFVNQVDKLKFEMEKSLKELENNFNSLMNKAFKGELF